MEAERHELSSGSKRGPSMIEDHWIQCLRSEDAFAFATTFWSAQQKLSDSEEVAKQAEASGQVLFLDREALKATIPFLCQQAAAQPHDTVVLNGSMYRKSAVAILAVKEYEIYVWCMDVKDTKVTGSHWIKASTPLSILAEKMDNDNLSTHLLTEQTFTMAELSDIGCTDVRANHYIEVGDSCFIPDVQRDMLGQAFSRYVKPSFCKYYSVSRGQICGDLEMNERPTRVNLVWADASQHLQNLTDEAHTASRPGSPLTPHAPSSQSKADDCSSISSTARSQGASTQDKQNKWERTSSIAGFLEPPQSNLADLPVDKLRHLYLDLRGNFIDLQAANAKLSQRNSKLSQRNSEHISANTKLSQRNSELMRDVHQLVKIVGTANGVVRRLSAAFETAELE